MDTQHTPKVGDVWHRVDGAYKDDGSESYVGMELSWQQWRVMKVTPRGAWLKCVEWPYKKQRFALAIGARWVSRSKAEALVSLIARKRRHIAIVELQAEAARETLALAQTALSELKTASQSGGAA